MHDAVGVADWLSSYGSTEKIGIDAISARMERNLPTVFFGNNGI